ncbi:unnamed protein product [Prunus armeniaca]
MSCGLILSISGEKLEDILIDLNFLSTRKNLFAKYVLWRAQNLKKAEKPHQSKAVRKIRKSIMTSKVWKKVINSVTGEGTAVEATIYVFVSASIQDIIRRFKEARSNLMNYQRSIWVGIKRGTLLATALRAYAADPDLQQEWMMVKKVNKMRLAEYIEAMSGVMVWSQVCLDAMFDVHTKQIHEYKKGSCLIYLALSINMTVSRTTLYLLKGAIAILQQCAYQVHILVTYLKLSGDDIWIGQSLGKSTPLEKAEFFLDSNRHCFKILSEVLSSINKVETLALNREITMVIFFPSMAIGAVFYGDFIPLLLENVCYLSIHVGSVRDMLLENALLKKGPMPTPFDIDVRYLRMEIEGLLGKIVPAVVSYLKGLRNLRTLHIKANIFPVDSETEVKKVNKMRLAEYIEAMSGVKVSLHAMFDVQTKRIREYQKGSCLIYLALSIDMTVSRYSRPAILFKYVRACSRRGRNLQSQSLLRPPGSAPEKDPTHLGARPAA